MEGKCQILIYQTEYGLTKISVKLEDENIWLSIDQMAALFGRDKSTISRHIKNIFKEGELQQLLQTIKYIKLITIILM